MIAWETLLIFAPAALALNLKPGNDMLFCLSQGMKSGPRAGIAASFGIAAGVLLHTLAAAIGLAALLAAHPAAFDALRWAGAAYLAWLAIQTIREAGALQVGASVERSSPLRAWREAVLVSLLNPKVAVFVLAFLPQFVDPARGDSFSQFMILGLVLNTGGTVINCLVGGFAGTIGHWLTEKPGVASALQKVTGALLLALAARIAFDRH